ncbi:MAG: head-tail connector protein [Oscillospiraceae bacterium]|nr:head-tail connector protein [Oscillospiraceae bacterium]
MRRRVDQPLLLLARVKQNLILEHSADDDLLLGVIRAAVSYAESYQHRPTGHYTKTPLPPTSEQAVVMLASHWYESRDGSTGGFFGDKVGAAATVMGAVNNLLRLDRDWGAGV